MKMDDDEISFKSGWKGYLHRGINPNRSLEMCINHKYEVYSLLYVIFSNDGH